MNSSTHSQTKAILQDAWDYKGRPADRSKTGRWTAAAMILGLNLNTSFLFSFISDGVTILTISTIIPSLRPPRCTVESSSHCAPATDFQLTILYIALYTTALGTGGLKSSVSGFGSDQFDESDKEERAQMSAFFNWFFFFISIGSLAAVTVLVYIQDNLGRQWGYGICACAIVAGLVVFVSGTKKYRFKKLVGSPLTQIATVIVAAWRKRNMDLPTDSSFLFDIDDFEDERRNGKMKKQKLPRSKQFRLVL
ncbi:protein NRT1/ PTR FAMILY 6.3-like [Cucumis melo var. makuwa]|uniref:Protein NRT1/ PTR FAMILY 6.3-like n=1 Tax=Cucumis melo var. makuwa TaxID=1194695 RepID=A0A5D3D7E3_CUCMM|nr:protein NRT1/ PTR FAMILY 6.3-like [Cucumis melo var. makuwa]